MHARSMVEHDLSPFMRNGMFYGSDEKAIEATRSTAQFANFIKTDWSKIKSYFDLFWNGKSLILYPKLQDELKRYDQMPLSKVANDFDAAMALHHLLLATTGISRVLPPNDLSEYTEISTALFHKDLPDKIMAYINEQSFEPNDIERKAFRLIDAFTKIYSQLIPVVALKNAGCIDNVDREQFAIITANFDELTDFYAKSYEWLLNNVDIIISLNNISERGEYDNCINGRKYSDILSASKFKRLEYIDSTEPFSKPLLSLKNRIRNALQHFDCEIDYGTQFFTVFLLFLSYARERERG
jgi:hypothetical protein